MPNKVEMIFWDVQHGHATYIKTPNGKHIVIDLGIGDYSGNNQAFSPLVELRNKYQVKKIDYVVLTHPHLDHIDDILNFDSFSPTVLRRPKHLANAEVMAGVRDQDKAKFEKYCEINDRYSLNISGGTDDPDVSDNLGGLVIKTFSTPDLPKNNFNNHSILTVIEYEGIKAVIPGDNEYASLDKMMELTSFKDAVKDSDILLAPHHGRESAYHNDFVNLVNPRIAIVSDGSYCDTSANGRYSQKSRGWRVYNRTKNEHVDRKCLTTNSDGEVYVSFGLSTDPNFRNFLGIEVA